MNPTRAFPRLSVLLPLLLVAASAAVQAAEPKPEIERPAAPPQGNGAVHTLRTIPEACTRLEGRFTGRADEPYQLRAVASGVNCQPRARMVDIAQANPERGGGWIWHDRIRVPSAACSAQVAVLDVWRKAGSKRPLELDAQGRARVYLQDAMANAEAARASLPQYAVRMGVEGEACR